MRLACIALVPAVLAGCATQAPAPAGPASGPGADSKPVAAARSADCRDEVAKLRAQLASETAERQRLLRAASKREETLRKQLDAMKSIERGILEREERTKSETR